MTANVHQLDRSYIPPAVDPRATSGLEWTKLTEQLQFAREALAEAEASAAEGQRRIAQLLNENERLHHERDMAVRESVSMRTALEIGASIYVQILEKARHARDLSVPLTKDEETEVTGLITRLGERKAEREKTELPERPSL